LTELNTAGQTVMLTTHYMEEADQLCDRVAIMDHGKILALDTPANLKQSTGADTIVTIKVAANAEQLAETLKHDIDAIVTTRVHENALIVDMRSTERLVPRIVASAESSNVEILDLAVAEPTLETVFINLTGKELRDA
jgi:ABC-2 type transport system ATP-binding protein